MGGAFVALVIEEALILVDQTICRNAQDVVEGRPHLAVLRGRHWLVILVSCQKNKERYRFTKLGNNASNVSKHPTTAAVVLSVKALGAHAEGWVFESWP